MFRDNRRKTLRNRVLFTALGVLIMTFGIWLNYRSEEPAPQSEETAKEVAVAEKENSEQDMEPTQKEEEVDETAETADIEDLEDTEGTDTEMVPEAYLIKEMDGVVKVFLCNADGSRELYLVTSIPFELLSESDQQLLRDGVRIETEDDLGKFLENFDS